MKCYIIFWTFTFCTTECFSQNNSPQQQYEQFRKQAKEQFNDFRKKTNEQYATFLKQAWEQYKGLPAIPRPKDEILPPVIIPEKDIEKPIENQPVPLKDVVIPPVPEPQPNPVSPIKEQPTTTDDFVEFYYYGTKCEIRINKNMKLSLSDCDNERLSEVWITLSKEGLMNNTIRDCLLIRANMSLCDWAYLNMLSVFSKSIYPKSVVSVMMITPSIF